EAIATAIRIGNQASWELGEAAGDESGGYIHSVTDDEIVNAYKKIASQDGVFIEAGSAASLAGVIQHVANGTIKKEETVVCVFSGNGLKDPATAMRVHEIPISHVVDIGAMRTHLRSGVKD
ncbi:pyridoxal-phosphate dependent enzyme, partial [Listeria monocytogenes]|uniref:pyridoxal-phosphate dependent enzyme n=1 Tax=Listeria monocytogenes TaxID=1639 RepID=UPI0005808D0D